MYESRTYRHWVKDTDLISFKVSVGETDLYIRSCRNLERKAVKSVEKYRAQVEMYIERHPVFLTSLAPVVVECDAPQIVREMAQMAEVVGLGPMASVAGAIAEKVGQALLPFSSEVIVENGGDIFLKLVKNRTVAVYAGKSPLTGKIALEIAHHNTPLGICASSGTVGHSLSFGKADAVVALSPSTALADATATAIGNIVSTSEDINIGLDFAMGIDGLTGVLIIIDDKMGVWGDVKLIAI